MSLTTQQMLVRVSLGTLVALGLSKVRVDALPTTAYLLQWSENGCLGDCAFCSQSRSAISRRELLSRVEWPQIELEKLAERLAEHPGPIRRVCLQTVIKEGFEREALEILAKLRNYGAKMPASLAVTPVPDEVLLEARKLGVTHVGVGLDAATPELVQKVRKPYSWEEYWAFTKRVVELFGPKRAFVHLIFGLGESEVEFIEAMALAYKLGADVALFAFTPVPGTPMSARKQPPLEAYRRMQAARYLLSKGAKREKVLRLLERGELSPPPEATLTSGCPWCNRPYYNERPSGPIYNYPSLEMALKREVASHWASQRSIRAGSSLR